MSIKNIKYYAVAIIFGFISHINLNAMDTQPTNLRTSGEFGKQDQALDKAPSEQPNVPTETSTSTSAPQTSATPTSIQDSQKKKIKQKEKKITEDEEKLNKVTTETIQALNSELNNNNIQAIYNYFYNIFPTIEDATYQYALKKWLSEKIKIGYIYLAYLPIKIAADESGIDSKIIKTLILKYIFLASLVLSKEIADDRDGDKKYAHCLKACNEKISASKKLSAHTVEYAKKEARKFFKSLNNANSFSVSDLTYFWSHLIDLDTYNNKPYYQAAWDPKEYKRKLYFKSDEDIQTVIASKKSGIFSGGLEERRIEIIKSYLKTTKD